MDRSRTYGRAGSAMPSGMGAESHTRTVDQEEPGKKCPRREDLAQSMIRGTVSDGIDVSLPGCFSAKQLYHFALETNSLEDPETSAEIWIEFTKIWLDEDSTEKQM
jgi:hypothetical protein